MKKIKAVSSFIVNVKEIEALVGSIINGLAKGIKQKITLNRLEDDSGGSNHHTPLLEGAYKVVEIILDKSNALKELKVSDFIKILLKKI